MDGFSDAFLAKLTSSAVVGGVTRYAWTEQIIDPATSVASDAPSPRSGTTTSSWAQEINNLSLPTPTFAMLRLRSIVLGVPVYDFQVGAGDDDYYVRLTGNPGVSCGYLEGVLQVKTNVGGCWKYVDGATVQVLDLNATSGSA